MNKETLHEAIAAQLVDAPEAGTKVADLASSLGLDKKDQYKLRRALTQLLDADVIQRVSRGHYALTEAAAKKRSDEARRSRRDAARDETSASGARGERKSKSKKSQERGDGKQQKQAKKERRGQQGKGKQSREQQARGETEKQGDERRDSSQRRERAASESDRDERRRDRDERRRDRDERRRDRMASDRGQEVPTPDPARTGRISVHPAGYGFVAAEDGSDDIFVPAKYRNGAMDGDRVELSTWEGYKGTEGKVVRVISRGRAKLTGTLRRSGRTIYLEPDDPRIVTDFGHVSLVDRAPSSKLGQAALVEISHYPSKNDPSIAGRLVRILGDPDDPRTEIEKIIICADIPDGFPRGALSQAEATPGEVRPEDLADRIDLRDRPFVTIDPENARDFDDALCVEDGPGGTTRVWIAVADVSHYVREGDALDREAVVRGVSVYLPDRVLPMLPFPLSAGICSLNPEVDRCAMVVRLDFDQSHRIVNTGFAAAVIRSHARLDYPGVAAALSGDFRGRRMHYRRWAKNLARLDRLARTMRDRRLERGALELDIPEAKVLLDDDDPLLVRDIVRSKGSEDVKHAYQLVEEFMIAANEAVGTFFRDRDLPALWRVHAPPDPSRLDELAAILKSYGIDFDVEDAQTPKGMKRALESLRGKRAERALSFLVLRSLTQAVYDTQPIGHFGLASPNYLHFTPPLRRYPGLIVHRLLKRQLHREGQPSGGGVRIRAADKNQLDEIARAVSQHERRAMEAEREAVSMYRAYLMRDQVGEEVTGTISAVTQYGAFVEIDDPFIEGLIKIDQIGDDAFVHDAHKMRLSGRHTGFRLQLGDSVMTQITDASVPLRRVDMRLVSANGHRPPRAPEGRGGKKRRRRRFFGYR